MDKQTITVLFSEMDEALDPSVLGDFLLLIRAFYAAATMTTKAHSPSKLPISPLEAADDTFAYIKSLSIKDRNSLFSRDLGDQSLEIIKVRHESPLEIIFCGVFIPLPCSCIKPVSHSAPVQC